MARLKDDLNSEEFRALPYLVCLSLIWIYIGAVRSWILPSLSNYLYFAYFPVLVALWFRSARTRRTQFRILSIFMSLLVIFQIIHIIFGNIDLVSGIYGLITYETPLIFIMIFARSQIGDRELASLTRYILLTLPVNLIVVFFQVVIRSPRLQKVEFTETSLLGTANGVVRATGTFTSSAGFSFYVIFLGLILYIATSKKIINVPAGICFAIILAILTLFSGSRTILIFMILNLLVVLLTRKNRVSGKAGAFKLKLAIVAMLLGAYKIVTTSNTQVIQSFSQRISDASRTENTFQRVVNSVLEPFKHFQDWTIFGQGLGAYGRGSLGYGSSLWVENDLSKNILECGLVFGGLVIITRLVIATKLILFVRQYWDTQRTECLMATITFVPIIIAGQVTNQGSLLLGICICSSLVLKLIQA